MISRRAESGTLPGTYSELQRGRKPCSSCDVIIGAGRKKCPVCEAVFGAGLREDAPAEAVDVPHAPILMGSWKGATVQNVTVIPAGRCPVKLDSTDEDEVRTWSTKVAQYWRDSGPDTALAMEAVEWWARSFYPFKSHEHTRVCCVLRQHPGVAQTA